MDLVVGGPGLALIEMSKVEQRYRAVLAVQAGDRISEVAHRLGVSRQSVHTWLARYAEQGLAGLGTGPGGRIPARIRQTRKLRPRCGTGRDHPRWGTRRIEFELGRNGCPGRVPTRMTVYRILVRHGLIEPAKRGRKRRDYRRWQREEPMQLWQMDIVLRCLPAGRGGGEGGHLRGRPFPLLFSTTLIINRFGVLTN